MWLIDLNYSAIRAVTKGSIGDKGYVFIWIRTETLFYHPSQQQLYNELQTDKHRYCYECGF